MHQNQTQTQTPTQVSAGDQALHPTAAGVGVEAPAKPQAQTQVHQQLPADTNLQAAASPVSSPANMALEPSQSVTAPMPTASRSMQDAAASRHSMLDFPDTGPAQQSSAQPARQSSPSSNSASPIARSSNDTSGSTVFTQAAAAAPEGARSSSGSRAGQSPAAPELSVTWLGTSSGSPSLRRNVSCIALTLGQSTYLVDCGEGTSRQVLRANIHPACTKGVFISHLHGDHCFGLPGLIELVSEAHEAAKSPNDLRTLQVFGPPGIQQLVKGALAVSHVYACCDDIPGANVPAQIVLGIPVLLLWICLDITSSSDNRQLEYGSDYAAMRRTDYITAVELFTALDPQRNPISDQAACIALHQAEPLLAGQRMWCPAFGSH